MSVRRRRTAILGLMFALTLRAPLFADPVTWVGAGTNGVTAKDPADGKTRWQDPANWVNANDSGLPSIEGQGETSLTQISLENPGRVFSRGLETRQLVVQDQAPHPHLASRLIFEEGRYTIGEELLVTSSAIVEQAGGQLEVLGDGGQLTISGGGRFRLTGGHATSHTVKIEGRDSRLELGGGNLRVKELIVGSPGDEVAPHLCIHDGVLRADAITIHGQIPFDSCRSGGRIETSLITASGGQITDPGGTLAPTDLAGLKETAILNIKGDLETWGHLEWQLNGTEPGAGYDQVAVDGELLLSGGLEVIIVPPRDDDTPAFFPKQGDMFDIVVADFILLTEIGLLWPESHLGPLFGGEFDMIDGRHRLRLIAQYDYRLGVADFDRDGQLTASDVDLLAQATRADEPDELFDLDQNGVVDRSDHGIWVHKVYETSRGDANLDRAFTTTDLVIAFAAGEYEDGVPMNSGWAEGDWDGDG